MKQHLAAIAFVLQYNHVPCTAQLFKQVTASCRTGSSPGLSGRTCQERSSPAIHNSVRTPSFRKWLEHRVQEVPDAGTLALTIARAGTAGVSRGALLRVIKTSPKTLESLLRALVAARHVLVVKVNGERSYRVPM